MAWEENSCISLNMQLIAILSRIGVIIYKKNSSTFYFEMGISPKSYSPSQKRERYRREWEAIIIKYINKVCL